MSSAAKLSNSSKKLSNRVGEIPVNLGSRCWRSKGRHQTLSEDLLLRAARCGVGGRGKGLAAGEGAGLAGDRLGAFRRESGSRCRHSLGAEHPRPAGSPPPWGFVSFCFPLSVIHEQVRLNPAASDSLDPAPQRGRSGCGRTGLWVPGSRTDSKSQRPWEGAPRTPRKGRWGCQAPGLAGHACAGSGEGKTLHTPIPVLPPPH